MASERETFFFDSLWTRLRDRDGTEDGRALNGIVYHWRSSKYGCTVLSVKAVTMAGVDAAQFDIRAPGR